LFSLSGQPNAPHMTVKCAALSFVNVCHKCCMEGRLACCPHIWKVLLLKHIGSPSPFLLGTHRVCSPGANIVVVGISHARPECPEPWTRCSERAKCLFGRAGERHHVSRASPGRVCWRSRRRSGPSTRTRARALTFNPGHTFNPGDRMIDRAPDVALQISRSRIHSHRPSPSTAAPLPYSPAALHPPAISLAQWPFDQGSC